MRQWLRRERHARNKDRATAKLLRLIYYRLVIPIRRARDKPEIIARGVGVGLLLGLTPTVGLQMYMIFMVWILLRRFWNFNVVLAMAWSWLSNPATMLPMYYMFYLTGKLIMFDLGNHASFDLFTEQLNAVMRADNENAVKAILELVENLWDTFGWSIVIGCLPYSIGGGILGYWMTYRIVKRPAA